VLREDLLHALERADGPPLIAYRTEGDLPLVEVDWHIHVRGQLFYVEAGLFISETREGAWYLPPGCAGWMPPNTEHTVRLRGPSRGWGLFVSPDMAVCMPAAACVVGVNELLRALVLRASTWTDHEHLDSEQQRVMSVLIDEMKKAPVQATLVRTPTDRRLRSMAAMLIDDPGDTRDVRAWAAVCGLSVRTMARLFREETGLSFASWRQQLRLSRALEQLARGSRVAEVADALGYSTTSAFIAMFRKAYGLSPGQYFSTNAA